MESREYRRKRQVAMKRSVVRTLTARVIARIYNRAYTERDLKHMVSLFNEVNADGMVLSLEDIEVDDIQEEEEV